MSAHRPDARIWLPLAAAAACFAARAAPPAEPAARAPVHRIAAVALPTLHGQLAAAERREHQLDPERTAVHFLVRGPRGEVLLRSTGVRGELRLEAGERGSEMVLEFDLASLQTVDHGPPDLDLAHVLGVHRGERLQWHGRLVEAAGTDLPGVHRCTWLGTLRFGGRVLQQPMQTWLCLLPGRPPRLQGHGSVAASDYGLPRRRWLGLWPERYEVTLGLDLGWSRHHAH